MLRKKREREAANVIAATYRMIKARYCYSRLLFAVVKIQSSQRRKAAVKTVNKIRDPYGDMTFKELEQLYADEHDRLDKAVENKQFQIAAEIESNMVPLKQ